MKVISKALVSMNEVG